MEPVDRIQGTLERTAGRLPRGARFGTLLLLTLLTAWPAPGGRAQDIVISEILALGGDLVDEDGDPSVWIEIANLGSSPVNLGGWYLTDDPALLAKWRFPDTPLGAGEYLVVFATGKDRAVAGQQLHTSFRLSSAGELLLLVRPDGVTPAHGYAPRYPEQVDDVSFGLGPAAGRVDLVAAGAAARFLVPTEAGPPGWLLPGFDDSSWGEGTTGIGYGLGEGLVIPPEGAENVAEGGTATQSSDYGGGQFPASLAIDGDLGNFTHTEAGVNLPATWELDLGEPHAIYSIVLYNRAGCCPSRLRDITVSILDELGGSVLYESELLNPENVLGGGGVGGPEILTVDLVAETGGGLIGRAVRVVRTPDPDLSGTGGQGNPDEADVLSLGEVEVIGVSAELESPVATDVGAALEGVNASIYVRIPFVLEDGVTLESLRLRMRYDDGFAAYLNGREVARRNAPAALEWNSSASAERPAGQEGAAEDIDISAHSDALVAGANVLAIHALNFRADDTDLLVLPELEGSPSSGLAWRYFREPTPGAPNDTAGVVGFVADTRFSMDRGLYDAPIVVEITTETAGAEIRYTLDGTPPTESSGFLYEGPLRIEGTTTLRAAAFHPELEPSNVDTQTYIFVDDVVAQDYQATLEAGFPRSWGGTAADYGMDPDVIGPNDRFGGIYAETIREDLKSLPSMSIVLKTDDMFGSRGIYTNSTAGGPAWERPASVELIYPDGKPGFQENCGIRIQGGWFRSHSGTRKHSFRLLFKRQYGPTKLRYPLFGPRASQRFDTLTLRAGANDGYAWNAARLTEQYTRDEFGRDLQRATGNAAADGTFVHLYINGIYWGLYNPVERPDHSFSASYYGGDKEDWDSVHDGAPTNGDLRAFNDMLRQTSAARASLDAYQQLQGLNPDGSPNPSYPHLLDVPNYIDYLVVNLWGGNWDWPWKNWWAGRDRTAASTGFKFYCWDYENTMGNNRDRSPLTKNALQNNFSSAGQPHTNLQGNPEYRLEFADHVHRHFFNDGILTPEYLIERYAELVAQVERAIVAESARWGDQHHNPPLTLTEWRRERDWLLGSYLPQRSAIVLQQFVGAGLYPRLEAPTFQPRGGVIEPGLGLIITAPLGVVYVTLDGTDPRLPGGAVSPTAIVASGGDSIEVFSAGAPVRILVPQDGSLGLDWTLLGFDDSSWLAGTTGVGFEGRTGYEDLIATDVLDIMYEKSASIYLRVPFDVDPTLLGGDVGALALVTLGMMYDDGYVAYLNGERVAAQRAPEPTQWDSRASGAHSDSQAVIFENVALPGAISLLRPGANLLAIHGLNSSATSNDFLIVPRLSGIPRSDAIVIDETTTVRARTLDEQTWSALNEATFVVDTPLRITEVLYHPLPPAAGGFFEEGDFEFVELQNVGTERVDLAGIRIEGGISFAFAESDVTSLGPGQIVVLVKNLEAFASRYATAGMLIGGVYRGRLDNSGDYIILRGARGEAILDFDFDDEWYPETDGLGPSLVIADSRGEPATWGESSRWRPSDFPLGSPGIDESGSAGPEGWQVPGDLNQDVRLDLSDGVALLRHLFMGEFPVLPCAGGSLADEANRTLLDSNGDGDVSISDAIYLLNYLFLGGEPPPLGTGCIRIPGCPDACEG